MRFKKILFTLFCVGTQVYSFSQNKNLLKVEDLNNWPSLTSPVLSNDGRYFAYSVPTIRGRNLILKSTNDQKQLVFSISKSSKVLFSKNSRELFFVNPGDSLAIFRMHDFQLSFIPKISSYELLENSLNRYIIYRSSLDSLVIYDINSGLTKYLPSVYKFWPINENRSILVQRNRTNELMKPTSLYVYNLDTFSFSEIWSGLNIQQLLVDESSKQYVFTIKDKIRGTVVLSGNIHSNYAKEVLNDSAVGAKLNGLAIGLISKVSKDQTRIFFSLVESDSQDKDALKTKVEVWSFTDPMLYTRQLRNIRRNTFQGVLNLKTGDFYRLTFQDEIVVGITPELNEDFIVVLRSSGDSKEKMWNSTSDRIINLVSTVNSRRVCIDNQNIQRFWLDPSGNYLVFYDSESSNYFSYNIYSKIYRNLTEKIDGNWWLPDLGPGSEKIPIGIAGFVDDQKSILIYDQNDLFKVDMSGNNPAINLTKGFGKLNGFVFRICSNRNFVISNNETLVLSAFNLKNKEDGFFGLDLKSKDKPKLLTMQSAMFVGINENCDFDTEYPIKAGDSQMYVVRRMTAWQSPQYLFTRDFKNFKVLTDWRPEENFNWLTSELIEWKSDDGNLLQGILYKPENFDSTKKYPVIFQYYERFSNGLNGFVTPALCEGAINVPFFVSNGYIVFVPDIKYKIGRPGASSLNSIRPAAKYLSRFNWIDSQKMGLVGHSFGGYETNFIISQTSLFSAAISAAGVSNFTSAYGSLEKNGSSRQSVYEYGQSRVGASLWNAPGLYIKNSPLFFADKISTPILINSNREDGQVPFAQGLEFFNALRRLGKRSWLLQYDGEGHTIDNHENQIDYSIRVKQFFDHYLKDSAAPKWMLYGIPAKSKGIDDGLELVREKDSKTNRWLTPKTGGLLTDEEKKKVEALKMRKPITITID